MAKKTVSKEQLESYGKFVVEPSAKQLSEYFLLDDHDLIIIDALRSDTNKLGLTIQLGTIRFIGLFLSNPTEVPYRVVEYVAEQLQLAPSQFQFYHKDTMRSTISYHVQLIKDQYGYQDFSSVASIMALETWLKNRLLVTNERPTLTFDWLVAKCVSEKIVLPGLTVIERFITKIKDNVEHLILAKLSDLPNPSEITKMMSLLTSASKDSEHKELVYRLEDLRRSLDNDSQKELARGIERVRSFNQFDTSSWNLTDIPEGKIHYYARIGSDTRVQNIQRMSKDRQVAVLASFIYHYKKVATDELLTIFSQYLHSRFKRVKREEEKDRLRTLNDLDGAANKLMRAMTYFLDESIPDEQLRATIYTQFSREELSESIARVNRLTSDDKDPITITNILNYYSTIKKFLPDILELIDFKGTIHGEKIIQLWAFLQKQTSNRITADAYAEMKALLPYKWAKYGERHPKSRMKVIVFSTLEQVLPALKNHYIFLSESIKYSNPLDALFPKDEWALIRQDMAEKMELPITVDPLLNELAITLRSSYRSVLDTWETNTLCRIEKVKGKNRLVLKNISKLIETDSLIDLRKNVAQLIPRPDVTEVLLEVDKRENYTSCFNHLSDNAPRMKQFDISMNAILLSEACNIGLSPVTKTNVKALTKDRLVWGKHNYLRPETIAEANNVIVAAHSQLKLSQYFGNGDIASADGLRFSTPVNSIHSGPNPKYFGFGKGITYYNFVSEQFSGFHGMVVPGTERDSLYVLEGLLEQTSPLNPS